MFARVSERASVSASRALGSSPRVSACSADVSIISTLVSSWIGPSWIA